MENIQQSKSQLARLLAVENISVQHQAGAKTAWFDVKNRVLTLPVWREMSNDLYDMLVVHEVGHALDTPADDWVGAIEKISAKVDPAKPKAAMMRIKGFMNVIEDARIDKRQKRRFPGSKRNYLAGYKDLIERDFFGTARRDVNAMSFIDRLNIYFKGGVGLGIKFSAEEMPMLKAVENAETFEEVIELTEKIYLWSKNRKDQDQEIQDQHRFAEGDEGDDEQDFEDFDVEESDDESEETDGKGKAKSEQTDDQEETEDDSEDGDDAGDDDGDDDGSPEANGSGDDSEENDLPESETEKAWEQKQEELLADGNTEYHYIGIPTFDMSKVVDDYKVVLKELSENFNNQKAYSPHRYDSLTNEFVSFKSSEAASISFMVKEFEMRKSADEYSRTSVAKTGVIDTNKLHSYKFNDDIFRRVATVATGKNHGFVMFIDWSGSMVYNLRNTIKQLLSFAMFCKRVQVPFEVYSFRTPVSDREHEVYRGGITYKMGDIGMRDFKLRNLLSSRMKIHELNEAMLYLWYMGNGCNSSSDYLNSTPLNQAIAIAPEVVELFKARTKVQVVNTIVLTDGQSDPSDEIHGVNHYDWNKNHKFILQDRVTKKTYEMSSARKGASFGNVMTQDKTNVLLRRLKDRTGCNLIGFYIHGSNFRRAFEEIHSYSGWSQDFFEENRKSWLNDGFIVSNKSGYDEYYILNTNKLDIEKSELKIDDTMTKGKIAKEFMKFSGNKAVNRVLLQRFVKKIAA